MSSTYSIDEKLGMKLGMKLGKLGMKLGKLGNVRVDSGVNDGQFSPEKLGMKLGNRFFFLFGSRECFSFWEPLFILVWRSSPHQIQKTVPIL
jgi:hypothetical protein